MTENTKRMKELDKIIKMRITQRYNRTVKNAKKSKIKKSKIKKSFKKCLKFCGNEYMKNADKTQTKYGLGKFTKKETKLMKMGCVNNYCNVNDKGEPTCEENGINTDFPDANNKYAKNGRLKIYSQTQKNKLMEKGVISGCFPTDSV